MNKLEFMLGVFIVGMAAGVFAQAPVLSRAALLATTLNADSEKYLDMAVAKPAQRGG